MRIAVVGAGYVGLVTGVCFAEFGFNVVCVDSDARKVAALRKGIVPIFEPGLKGKLRWNQEAGRFAASDDLGAAVREADIIFIAVGTPTTPGNGAADTRFVEIAARQIAGNLRGFSVVVIKSTVPVGCCRRIEALIRETNPKADFEIASNPEFLREGSAVDDFLHPDRVVIGVNSERARESLVSLYKPLSQQDTPILVTGLESAELTKYAANSFLAMKVTFINQIADLCEQVGADALEVARGIGLDERIGQRFLQPGPGIGGSCFPKDTEALAAIARDAGSPISIIDAVVSANNERKAAIARRIIDAMGGDAKAKKIGILGVTFKANTDDMREAPSLVIIPRLQQAGARIAAYDPVAMGVAETLLPGTEWKSDAYEVARGADALVILTEWNEFKTLNLERIAEEMKTPLLIDLRCIYTLDEITGTPFIYHSIGRPAVMPSLRDSVSVISA